MNIGINKHNLINPYGLLGVTPNSTFNELKRNYYNMALMCHPDKGGSSDDMHIVQMAYNYCKEQLQSQEARQTTYEQLEMEFADFCQEQEEKAPPTFSSIYEETNEWITDFNKTFEKMNVDNTSNGGSEAASYSSQIMADPFSGGYGDLMDTNDDNNTNNENNQSLELIQPFEYEPVETNKPQQEFSKEIVEYKEPQYLPNTVNHFPLNTTQIDDFSGTTPNNSLIMTDYYKSYGKHKKMKESDFEFRDYPKSTPK